jgi:hypothetical protein
MNRLAMAAVVLMLALSLGYAQDAAPAQPSQGGAASDQKSLRGVIPVTLAKSIDSKKLKEGDPISAKTVAALQAGGGVMIPSGSMVVGHITQSSARSKGDPQSSLGLMFDKIELPGGKDMPIKGVIQAVGPNPSESSGPDTGAAGSGTMAAHGGDPTTMASPLSSPGAPIGQKNGNSGGGGKMLNSHSEGVVGIKNLQLESNSVLSSTGKEVKLDQGAQIIIKAE